MNIVFTKKAEKELSKLSRTEVRRVLEKIKLLDFPLPDFLDIKQMKGVEGFYRLRTGKIRVIFEIYNNEIWIRKIGYRKDVYR